METLSLPVIIPIVLLYKLFRLGIEVLTRYGFTTNLGHLDLPKHAQDKITEVLEAGEEKAYDFIDQFTKGTLEAIPGKSLKDSLESRIVQALNEARNNAEKIVTEFSQRESDTMIMALSGAKGKMINFTQMTACVGQQAMRGSRIENGFNGRTLSVFKKGELSPKSHGFIKVGYRHGLDPSEFFFQAMVGRDALMDTALRTPKSGYLYRRLANAMQDLKVEYDGTVRDAGSKIIQFTYGEDGIDVSKSERGKLNVSRIIHEVQ